MNPGKNSQLREKLLPYIELISDINKYTRSKWYEESTYIQNIPGLGDAIFSYRSTQRDPHTGNTFGVSWRIYIEEERICYVFTMNGYVFDIPYATINNDPDTVDEEKLKHAMFLYIQQLRSYLQNNHKEGGFKFVFAE